MDENAKQRIVAIVGRPNVGKSAIYNRLIGGRSAIVHEEQGVTRDRLVAETFWDGAPYTLIDTGGVSKPNAAAATDAIESGVKRQVEAALATAAVALLVVDVEAGCTPLDEAVAEWLRRSGCNTLVVANKADHAGRAPAADDFLRFGFPVFPVSALHNLGFDALMGAVMAALPGAEPEAEASAARDAVRDAVRVAIVGRPNVGKSSYINRLLGDERVIVSNVPGTTRDSIDIPFSVGLGAKARHYVLVDTAGVRRVGKIRTAVERFSLMRTEQTIERAHVVGLMLDAVQGPTAQDKKIAAMIKEHGRGAAVFVNKWDEAPSTQRQYDPALRKAMPFLAHCPIVYCSAHSGYNIRRSLEALDAVAAAVRQKLPTGVLNRALLEAVSRVQAPAPRGRRLKLYYATQVGTDPVRLRLFVNYPEAATGPYEEYLIRAVRKKFDLVGAPVVLQFRARRRNDGKSRDG